MQPTEMDSLGTAIEAEPVAPGRRAGTKGAVATAARSLGAPGGGNVRGVYHALLLAGIGAAAGAALVNLLYLLRMMVDAIVAGELEQPHLWPDARSLTVWTGVEWFTVTVMPVAFGRWGLAVCCDPVPRRAVPLELVAWARTEQDAHSRAVELAGQALSCAMRETVLVTR